MGRIKEEGGGTKTAPSIVNINNASLPLKSGGRRFQLSRSTTPFTVVCWYWVLFDVEKSHAAARGFAAWSKRDRQITTTARSRRQRRLTVLRRQCISTNISYSLVSIFQQPTLFPPSSFDFLTQVDRNRNRNRNCTVSKNGDLCSILQ